MPRSMWLVARPASWALTLVGALILLAVVGSVIWLSAPPHRIVVMTTGPAGSDYARLAVRYQTVLKRSGITLRLLPSDGGVENLRRMNNPHSRVVVGFAQAGLTSEVESPDLVSLGTMFFEPFWVFSRVPPSLGIQGLRGKRLSMGEQGDGTHVLSLQFLALNGIPKNFANWQSMTPEQGGDALLHGDIDAATMMGSWESPLVRRLVASSELYILRFPRADAYVALYPYLNKLLLPAGVGDLSRNTPPTDVVLLAPKASLIVKRDLRPEIQYLLLEAAEQIQSGQTLFQSAGQFPAAERGDVPLSPYATHFYKSGSPFLQRYLPFWLADLTNRLLLLLIPIMVVVYPLIHTVPRLYNWSMEHRIYRLYGELKFIETELESSGATEDLRARLQRLDRRANHMRIPLHFAHLVYRLRSHIYLVETRVRRSSG